MKYIQIRSDQMHMFCQVLQPKSNVLMYKIKIKLEFSYEQNDKIHDMDINIFDINIKIGGIDNKTHDTAANHQSKNLEKLYRSLHLRDPGRTFFNLVYSSVQRTM